MAIRSLKDFRYITQWRDKNDSPSPILPYPLARIIAARHLAIVHPQTTNEF
jgi:hypothetical protein